MTHRTLYFSGRPVVVSDGLDLDMIAGATFTRPGESVPEWMVGRWAFRALERAADAGSPLVEWKEAEAGPARLGTHEGQPGDGGGSAGSEPGGLPPTHSRHSDR